MNDLPTIAEGWKKRQANAQANQQPCCGKRHGAINGSEEMKDERTRDARNEGRRKRQRTQRSHELFHCGNKNRCLGQHSSTWTPMTKFGKAMSRPRVSVQPSAGCMPAVPVDSVTPSHFDF